MEIALENPTGFTIRFGHRLRRCHCRPSTDAQSTGWRYRSGQHCQLFNWAWYLSLEEQIWHPSHGFRIGGTVSSHPVSPLALDTDTSQSQLRLTCAERECVISASHKALRILENKGYPWRQPYQAPGDYLAHLKAAVVYIPMPFPVLSRRAVAALYNPRSHDILIATAGSPPSSRCANCPALHGQPAHPHRAVAFPPVPGRTSL